ncbi:MAG: FAD-dependent oxidoreductase [Pseudomonadota bacterium]
MESLAADLAQMQRTPLQTDHVDALSDAGKIVHFEIGEVIFEVGQALDKFIYILEGRVDLLDARTRQTFLPHGIGPTQFLGDIGFLRGGNSFLPMVASEPVKAICVPRDDMLQLMSQIPEMSDIVITVYAARRRRMLEAHNSSLLIIGADKDREMRKIASFAERNKIPSKMIDIDTDEAKAEAATCDISIDGPAVIIGNNRAIENPTILNVAEAFGLGLRLNEGEVFDVVIVGGGPSGVAAAVYAGAEGLSALLVEDTAIGGQAGTSSRIENYMGFPTGISGGDLVWRGEVQAMKFGTRFATPVRAEHLIRGKDGLFCVKLSNGAEVLAKSLIVATGVQYRRLALEGLEQFEGGGVYYAATESEARYCRKTDVYVIGGGNSAGQAAMYLSRSSDHVHLLVRGTSLAASMSDYLSSRLEADPKISLHYETQVSALHGDENLSGVTLKGPDGEREVPTRALFIMVGAAPNTEWLSGLIELDEKGFVVTGAPAGASSSYATSCPGIFAVGDVRAGSVKRVASAVGEGSVVISKVWEHVKG